MRKVLAVILLALVGCSPSTELSMDDQMFAAMMIPHHEQAIEMSNIALTNSTNQQILELATAIKDAQEPEIDLMKNWAGTMLGAHDGHVMAGMLTAEEIDDLKSANGVEFDRLFLLGMIKHHQGAIDMAEPVLSSNNPDVAALAESIIQTQQAEITAMQNLLAELAE